MEKRIEVSIFKKTGRKGFHFIWTDPSTGKRRYKKSGLMKRRDAQRAAVEFEEELNRSAQPTEMLWSDFVSEYDRQHLRFQSDGKKYQAYAAFGHFERITNVRLLCDVPQLMSGFRVGLLDSDMAQATKNGYLKHFRAAVNWATEQGMLSTKVPIKMLPVPESEMKGRPLTGAEYQSMLLVAKGVDHDDTLIDFMNGLWLSGLRRSEAMRLTWDRDAPFAIDLTGEYPRYRIRVNGQKSKRAQLAPMTPDFIEFLMRRKERDGFVFNPIGRYGRFTSDGVGKAVSAIGEEAGIVTDEEASRHATCHDFRRSFGDRWARRLMPADLKELMRHKSIETTMKYYVGRDVDDITARLYGIAEVTSNED